MVKFLLKGFLINHGGCKVNKKRGYTLIELVAVMAISTIAIAIGLTLTITAYRNYLNIVNKSIRDNEVNNGLLTIERLLTGYMIAEVRVNDENNTIEIDYLGSHGETKINTKKIKANTKQIFVETYKYINPTEPANKMPILMGISNFEIIKKKNLYYYKITLETGEEIIQCI